MLITPYTDNLEEYLLASDVIDYKNEAIAKLAKKIENRSNDNIEYIKNAYEYVRDNVSHSADINNDIITCNASDVLKAGHGICFAKSHLLAALLRYKSIPAGFCYQKLILDDETANFLVFHGLNGVYIKEYDKWIRLDARGNKPGVNAQFSIDTEKLAFPIRSEKGEADILTVYPTPDEYILDALKKNKTRSLLVDNLPKELAYGEKL